MAVLHDLPVELLEKIHYHVLNTTDVVARTSSDVHDDWASCHLCTSLRPNYMPTNTFSLFLFYDALFKVNGSTGRFPDWTKHVRFVFPSLLAMADVFDFWRREYQALDAIRRVKVFHRDGLEYEFNDGTQSSIWDLTSFTCKNGPPKKTNIRICDILNSYPELQLDHLECETQTGLYSYASSLTPEKKIGPWLEGLLQSSGWKQLSILSIESNISDELVHQLNTVFHEVKSIDEDDLCSFDLPGTPTAQEEDGTIIPYQNIPLPDYCTTDTLRNAIPSWMGGNPVKPAIIIKLERYGVSIRTKMAKMWIEFPWSDTRRSSWADPYGSRWHDHRKLPRHAHTSPSFTCKTVTSLHTCPGPDVVRPPKLYDGLDDYLRQHEGD